MDMIPEGSAHVIVYYFIVLFVFPMGYFRSKRNNNESTTVLNPRRSYP